MSSVAPYGDAMLALDFVGSRSAGTPYYMLNGVRYPSVTAVPGWTYTGGTAAGTGSYAPKADGSLQFFPSYTNLLLQSQTFDNASWVKVNSTVTADQTPAPNGTTTADLWARSSTATAYLTQAITKTAAAVTYAHSMWVKQSVGNYFALRLQGTYPARADVVFNLSTGAISSAATASGSFASASATIAPAANGFYFVTLTATTDTAATLNPLYSFNSNGVAADGVDSASNSAGYIWGAQLELGSTASTYVPTTTAAVTVAPPRITDAGYLAEEARTNVVLRSSMTGATSSTLPTGMSFQSAAGLTQTVVGIGDEYGLPYVDWSITGTTSGTVYPSLILTGTGTNAPAASNGQTWTGSVYYRVVSGSLPTGMINVGTQIFNGASYLSGLSSSSSSTATGFTRLTTTGTISNASTTGVSLYVGSGGGVTTGIVVNVVIRIYAPQLEQGSFATSPIPTTSVAVTRAADVGYINAFSAPTDGTILVTGSAATFSNSPILVGTGSSSSTSIYAGSAAGGTAAQYNGTTALVGGAFTVSPSINSVAFAYVGTASRAISVNGTAVVSSATTKGTFDRVLVGGLGSGNGSQAANAPIRRIVIYPRAMSNSELQAITTAGAY